MGSNTLQISKYKKIFITSFIATVASVAGLLAYSPTASAALDGENGPILYVENEKTLNGAASTQECDGPCDPPVEQPNSVVSTTDPDGVNRIVAAESTNPINDATISAPNSNNEHKIVYATNSPICDEDFNNHVELLPLENGDGCNMNNSSGSQINLNLVTIDGNRNPINGSEELVTLDPLYGEGVTSYDRVDELSFSPDGVNVLVTRSAYPNVYTNSLWSNGYGWFDPISPTSDAFTDDPVELGLKFQSDIDGYIRGAGIFVPLCDADEGSGYSCDIVYYDINLWSSTGEKLASLEDYPVQPSHPSNYEYGFWISAQFDEYIQIQANTTYIISYNPSNGRYAYTHYYFTGNSRDNGTLHGLASTAGDQNGVYAYGATSTFPTDSYRDSNYWIDPLFHLPPLWTIENVNIVTKEITTVVPPTFDPFLIGGYAQNGNIYFSKLNQPYMGPINGQLSHGSEYQVDVWVIPAGSNMPVQLTTTPAISEFYIDASPDVTKLLVADVSECYYYQGYSSNNCAYYYVNTSDGSLLPVVVAENFTPVFFSPDGASLIGTINNRLPSPLREALGDLELTPGRINFGTAVAFRANVSEAMLINQISLVREWAPKYTSTSVTPADVEVKPVSTPAVTTLANTGTNINIYLALLATLSTLAIVSILTSTRALSRQNR